MRHPLDRRGALAAFALLACAAPLVARDPTAPRFAAPRGPMRLTRVLERELGDGAAVIVTRSWRLRFVPQAAGYRVEGEQLAVEVEAPPALAALAEIERGNTQEGLFPIALDAAGLMVDEGGGDPGAIPGLPEATGDYLDQTGAAREAAMAYVAAVQQAGAAMTSSWPTDLFFPAATPRSEVRAVPLPGGASGTIAVRFAGALDPNKGRLAHAERRIVTSLDGTVRSSRETWSLAPGK